MQATSRLQATSVKHSNAMVEDHRPTIALFTPCTIPVFTWFSVSMFGNSLPVLVPGKIVSKHPEGRTGVFLESFRDVWPFFDVAGSVLLPRTSNGCSPYQEASDIKGHKFFWALRYPRTLPHSRESSFPTASCPLPVACD